ncbi:MAG: PhzF family phenazine biosynthesis protein [Thermovirgaceae bacterium]|nr:PhzF family phenazine biosynthesis protein [Synergistales bacterium]HRS48472.1 PhzF family phenazine biosynthesis protein [Thermovirgaceae bacterium]HRU90765.1 PhzF family phenazine biosynthesis protein [Thermovirgaceae bacterium]
MAIPGESHSVPMYQVDAFTGEPFRGNPAAVCLLDAFLPEDTMKKIAQEMNLSETAFVTPSTRGGESGSFAIRWFTPTVEVPLCGHATLASSWVIFTEKETSANLITFESASGTLSATREREGVTLDFPRNDSEPAAIPAGLLEALGLEAVEDAQVSPSAEMLLLRIEDEATLRSLRPKVEALLAVGRGDPPFQGVIVTSRSSTYDFVSRYFGPWEGIDEDPVTGAAHTVLAPYWSGIMGKDRFHAFQASKRGGALNIALVGDRVMISGKARIVLKGELYP